MPSTGIIYSRAFLKHDTGKDHPERGARLIAIVKALKESSLIERAELKLVKPIRLDPEKLLYVHSPALIEKVEKASVKGGYLDSDTVTSPDSFNVALLAVGGVFRAGDLVMDGKLTNAFCLIRPPGHHATRDEAMGFCLFNNAALLAAHLLKDKGLRRVLIVDWDVHHGNGTQDLFYQSREVLYFSVHQDGRTIYPGTGSFDEVGEGEGEGFNINLPLPPGVGDDVYLYALSEILPPIVEAYAPEFIVASVGFDAHRQDQLGALKLSAQGYYEIAKLVVELAHRHCSGRLVAVLEGGYNLKYIPKCAANTIAAFAGHPPPFREAATHTQPSVKSYVDGLLRRIKTVLSPYWPLKND